MSDIIGIIGCGWLGFPLAESFVKDGYLVHGSTTTKEKRGHLENAGIRPFYVALHESHVDGDIHAFLRGVSVLIINVPPKLRNGDKENYVRKMRLLYNTVKVSTIKKVIFVSSISVYGDIDGTVTEKMPANPITESGKQLAISEQLFWTDPELRTTIVRFGGLIGPDRHPVYRLAGRTGLSNGNEAINLIHLDDCIRILKTTISQNYWGEIFNGVYPHHPSKKEYYGTEALRRGLEPPEYTPDSGPKGKRIDSYQLISVKKFPFTAYIGS